MNKNCQQPGQYKCTNNGGSSGCNTVTPTKCVIYNGKTLTPLGIFEGENLNTILNTINEQYQELLDNPQGGFVAKNVGGGAEVYVESDDVKVEKFRTLETALGIKITQKDETIMIGVDETWLSNEFNEFLNTENFNNKIKDSIKGKLDIPTVEGTVENYPYFVGIDSSNNVSKINVDKFVKTITTNFSKFIEKPVNTVNEPNQSYKYLALLDEDGKSVRILSSNIGRNIFNYNGVTNQNAGLIQGYDFVWNTNNKKLIFKNLTDKTSDSSYNYFVVMNGSQVISKANSKEVFKRLPSTLTKQEKQEFRTNVGYISQSSDDTLHIDESDIVLGTSTFTEELKGVSDIDLAFVPSSFIGVFLNGLKLNSDQYRLGLPKSIKILSPVGENDIVTIIYNHKIY